MRASAFFDTNVLLYLLSDDAAKADRTEGLLARGGVVSVQVLNEFASIGLRKLALSVRELRDILSTVRSVCSVEPLVVGTHDLALDLTERFQLSFYDALIVAAALLAKCEVVYSEDMQDGQRLDGVTVRNPFAGV
jgi:predicted nucleic acid-binding protein